MFSNHSFPGRMKMDQRQQLIDSQTKVLLSLKDGETQRLGGQIRDVELKAESREKDEQLKRDQLKNSIAISRQRALDRKQRLLNEKRTEEARFAAKWRQSMQQLEEEDVQVHFGGDAVRVYISTSVKFLKLN